MGKNVLNPRLGFTLRASVNSEPASTLAHALRSFSADGIFFYIAIRASHPEPLRVALEEFVNITLGVIEELNPELNAFLGQKHFEVAVSGDMVMFGTDLKKNAFAGSLAEVVEVAIKNTVSNEATLCAGVTVDTSFTETIIMSPPQLEMVKPNIHLNLTSTVADLLKFKNILVRLLGKKDHKGKEEKLLTIIFLMFHSMSFNLHVQSMEGLADPIADYISLGQDLIKQLITKIRDEYRNDQKEKLEKFPFKFPFIQNFFDAVEQYGNGRLEVGINADKISAAVHIYGNDLRQIYKQITN